MMKIGAARTCERVRGRRDGSGSNTRHARTRSGAAAARAGAAAAVVRSLGAEAVTAGQDGSCGTDGGHWCSVAAAESVAAGHACRAWAQPELQVTAGSASAAAGWLRHSRGPPSQVQTPAGISISNARTTDSA